MESLYRKYRPQTFDEVVGQDLIVSTLKHAVVEKKISHAYLFCGPRGTGKTTLARLLAKALLCSHPQKTGLPDGACEICKSIAEGTHPDVLELDAASRTGVDNIRDEIISNVSFAPVRGKFKIYIIDEVHMLTTQAFNALLKTLEEPPAHVIFVLCTTDPQKILGTILSRVQRFDFKPISLEKMASHLENVCKKEGFSYQQEALSRVAHHAQGGMRDALSSLEQLSIFGDGNISAEAAQSLLGDSALSTLRSVVRALAERDAPTLFSELAVLADNGGDFVRFVQDVCVYVRDLYVLLAAGSGAEPALVSSAKKQDLLEDAQLFGSFTRLSRLLDVLGETLIEMKGSTNQRLVLEIAFARLVRPASELSLSALYDRVAALEQALSRLEAGGGVSGTRRGSVTGEPLGRENLAVGESAPQKDMAASRDLGMQSAADARSIAKPEIFRDHQAAQEMSSSPAVPGHSLAGATQQVASSTALPQANAQERAAQGQEAATVAVPTQAVENSAELQRRWERILAEVSSRRPDFGVILKRGKLTKDDGHMLTLTMSKKDLRNVTLLQKPDAEALVSRAVAAQFGIRRLSYVSAQAEVGGSPAQYAAPAAPQPEKQTPEPVTGDFSAVEHFEEALPQPSAADFGVSDRSGRSVPPAQLEQAAAPVSPATPSNLATPAESVNSAIPAAPTRPGSATEPADSATSARSTEPAASSAKAIQAADEMSQDNGQSEQFFADVAQIFGTGISVK